MPRPNRTSICNRPKVDQTKAAIDADIAAIETAQTNLDYTDIVAPSDGRMGVRLVDPGNIVHASDQGAIAILTQTQPTAVLFTLPAQTLDDVRDAMARGAVEVAAYDRDNVRLLSNGTLTTIDNLIDQTTATYRLKAMFGNADEKLWPGEFVNARLLLEIRKNVVVIPPLAVQRGPHGLFTWVVKADDTVKPRPIQTVTTPAIAPSSLRASMTASGWSPTANTSCRPTRRHHHPTAQHRDAGGCVVNISEPFIRRPVATLLLMAALGVRRHCLVSVPAGRAAAAGRLPDHPGQHDLAGASAETMATSVAAPLEQQFGQIAGVTQMTSPSSLGASTIVIQFDLDRNIDSAAQDVQAAITVASRQLPQALTTPPAYKKVNPADAPILMLSVHSDTVPLTTVDDYANIFLAQQISQISGVAQVLSFGDRSAVDPRSGRSGQACRTTGITLEDIRGMLIDATTNAAKGTINSDKSSFTIAANDQIIDAEQFNDVVLAYRNGAPIRVRDVGQAIAEPDRDRRAPGRTTRTASSWRSSSSPAPTSSRPSTRSSRSCRSSPRASRRRSRSTPFSTAPTTIRASVLDVEFTLVLTICLVVMVILVVPAQFVGDAHSERDRAAVAARHVRGDVCDGFQPRQSVAHGAHHRRRFRGG